MPNMCVSDAGYKNAETIRYAALSTAANIKQTVAIAQFALSAADAVSNFKKLMINLFYIQLLKKKQKKE